MPVDPMPAEETVERCWTIKGGKFAIEQAVVGPDTDWIEVVPRALLEEALEAMDRIPKCAGRKDCGRDDCEYANLHKAARSIRSHLRRTE